jgi:hypothetical protein
MQTLLEKAHEVARNLHAKNQLNITSAQGLSDHDRAIAQEVSRSLVIGILMMAGVEQKIAEAIVDVEIIGGQKVC